MSGPPTIIDLRQTETRVLQDQLNATTVALGDSTLASINSELTTPGRLIAQAVPSFVVTVNAGSIANPNTSKNRVLPPLNNSVLNFLGGTITFPSTSGTIVNSNGSNASITMGASQFVAVLVEINSSNQIVLTVGTPVGSLGAVVVPNSSSSNLQDGYIIAQSNSSSIIQHITNAMIYQFTGGGGGGIGTLVPYDVILGGTTPTGPVQQVSGEGTVGQVLTSNGALAKPTWQTPGLITQAVSSTITLANNHCYLVNTTSSAITLNLPSPVANMYFIVKDSTGNAEFNNITIHRFASELIDGVASDLIINLNSEAITFISDGTNWFVLGEYDNTVKPLIMATGGTITTNGNFKVHTFNSSGTFQILTGVGAVTSLVLGGGGGGGGGFGSNSGGGGGGGGQLVSVTSVKNYIPGSYNVTIGAGGTGAPDHNSNGLSGSASFFDIVTATGGNGGHSAGTGNTNGGDSGGNSGGGGGGTGGGIGGSGNGGNNGSNGAGLNGGNGGNGTFNSITGSPVQYAAGGGGGADNGGTGGTGGTPGGGNGGGFTSGGSAATTNSGSGGGGGGEGSGTSDTSGGPGGSGIVIITYKFQ